MQQMNWFKQCCRAGWVTLLFGAVTVIQAADRPIKIGWTAWSDAEVIGWVSRGLESGLQWVPAWG